MLTECKVSKESNAIKIEAVEQETHQSKLAREGKIGDRSNEECEWGARDRGTI